MSEVIEITGGNPLRGEVFASGAKNAALPLLIASLLTAERCEFENVPHLEDVSLTLGLLEHFGAETEYRPTVVAPGAPVRCTGRAAVQVPALLATEASYSLVKALRASFWILAPLLARGRAARVALPGGDIIGARPVDLHLAALTQMGADIKVKHGVVFATAVHGLHAADISLRFPSVGATHQILMAAALTPGTTVLRGAACEPEVVALAQMLNEMGGDIEGAGTSTIVVRGREALRGVRVTLPGDRIEAGTYLLAAIATRGALRVRGIDSAFLIGFLEVLDAIGVNVECDDDSVAVRCGHDLRAVSLKTAPFPGLATDLQAQLMAVLTMVPGVSTIEENIFEGRYGHVSELCRMGADIRISDRVAEIRGVPQLYGAPVEAMDIRAGASLVVAALAAEGTTSIAEPIHLRRGYELLEQKLRAIGASIGRRMADNEDYVFSGC